MSDTFTCKFCGRERPWHQRDYEVGLWLAERNSSDALGHTFGVTPYLICSQCADDVLREINDA